MYVGIICHFIRYLVHRKERIKDRVPNLNMLSYHDILLKLNQYFLLDSIFF